MKVLEVLGRSAGGIAKHVAQVHRHLAASDGFEVATAGPRGLPEPMPSPFHFVEIPDGPFGHGKAIRELTEIGSTYDLMHGHGLRAGIDAASAARRLSKPSVVTIHNLVRPEIAGRFKAPLYSYAEKLVVRLNERVLCVSEEIAAHLKTRTHPRFHDRIEVTYLGVDEPRQVRRTRSQVRSELGLTDDKRLVVTVARLAPQKALQVMFGAIHRISDATLVVLGDGPERADLEAMARDLLGERVRFLGYRADVLEHVAASDVFCLSSVWEGIPLSVMEAIHLEIPVVSTNVGGIPEIITNGISGRLVPPNDPVALADGLRSVLDDPALGRSYARAAKEHVKQHFSTERMLANLEAIYRGIDA